ncbi:MAG TPA: PAS domain S-box protein [Acidobacteriota bacterium]|nr:PAS domain S-box protein [Acidobacteriota bacterium]HQM61840.1 PAS domain S-box protein [Acidobacteriota bacterium]
MDNRYLSFEIDKLMEENRKLRSENRNFREILSCDQDLIIRYHILDRCFQYVSPAATTLTGHQPSAFYENPGLLAELVDAEHRPAFDAFWLAAAAGAADTELQLRFRHSDGHTVWAAMRTWPVINHMGRQVAVIGSIRDISLQKQMEERIRKLEGLIPICAGCKKIRLPDHTWQEIESFLARRSNMDFTHGLCPECRHRYFPSRP